MEPHINFLEPTLAPGFKPEDLVFVEEADYEKGFAAHFDSQLKPILLEANERRLACNEEMRKRTLISIPIIVVLIVAVLLYGYGFLTGGDSRDFFAVLKLVLIPIVVLGIWIAAPAARYRQSSKEQILPAIVKFYGFLDYVFSDSAPVEHLVTSRLVPPGDPELSVSEDHIHGTFQNVVVESWQLTTARYVGRGRRRRRQQLYMGMFIHFGLKKPLSGMTVVKFDHGLLDVAALDAAFSGLQHVSLEDPDFEKGFNVFSSDQVEARYMLTPDVMQHLKELQALFDAPIDCSFTGSDAFISIELNRKLFEPPPPNRSPISSREVHVFLNQMHHILSIIDLLNIDHR